MQRLGSHLRHLIPACPAAVLLAASPSIPQSQPRGSIEGTGRGKGFLSGKPMEQAVQASLLSLFTRLCSDPQMLPFSTNIQTESGKTYTHPSPICIDIYPLTPLPARPHPPWPSSTLPTTPASSPTHGSLR